MLLSFQKLGIKHENSKYIVDMRTLKIASIINFTLLLLILVIINRTPSASFYEISIYEVYPWYFWFLIITTIFIGEMVLLKSSLLSEKSNNFWIIGFISILLTNMILLFMPFIRGYIIYGRGDVLTHIGSINDICRVSSIGTNNFYPLDHILTVSLCYITNIKVEKAVNLIPPLFSIFYMGSVYILSRSIFEEKSEIIFTLAISSILLFSKNNLIFAPNVQSFLLFPFILYILFKSRSYKKTMEFSILLIIIIFCAVFFHPMTTIFLVITLLTIELSRIFVKKVYKKRITEWLNFQEKSMFNILFIILIIFFLWYFSFSLICKCFNTVINWFFFEIGSSEAGKYTTLISNTSPSILDIVQIILNMYGQVIILGTLFVIFSLYFFNAERKKKDNQKLKIYHLYFCIISIVFIVISALVFFNNFIIEFGRVSKYDIFFTSIFVAISYGLTYNRLKESKNSSSSKKIIYVSLCFVFILLIYFSIFNLYISPRIKSVNEQVTEDEIKGMASFYNHRNQGMLIQEIGISQERFHDLIFGTSVPSKNVRYGLDTLPIDHFGYTNDTNYGNYYDSSRYLLVSSSGRNLYPELYPKYEKYWRFTPEDFYNLEKDTSVLRIYDNPTLNIYLVKKI